MKLHEIKKTRRAANSDVVTIEPADGMYGEIDVRVEFDYEGESYTQHEPDNSSFREYHDASIDLESVTLDHDVQGVDDDGEPTDVIYKKGTDASKLPGWDKLDDDQIIDQLYKNIDHARANDFDEPDRDDDWR